MSHRAWNVGDEVTLKRLTRKGLSPEQIAPQLGRTPGSIRKRGAILRISFARSEIEKQAYEGSAIVTPMRKADLPIAT